MDKPNCKNCAYRETNEDGTKTLVDKKGNCFCILKVCERCNPGFKCVFYRDENLGQHDAAELIELIKSEPITVVEDLFLGRKLTIVERLVVNKFVKKYYNPSNK